jgi:hypothetical protein
MIGGSYERLISPASLKFKNTSSQVNTLGYSGT